MKYINDEKDPTLLGKYPLNSDLEDIQKMIDNLVRDSCYEDMFEVVQEGQNVYVKQKEA